MSIADRSVQTSWKGPLATGAGALGNGSSGALDGLPVTWAARTEQPGGKTSPEELAAAALYPVSRLFAGATISVDAQLA